MKFPARTASAMTIAAISLSGPLSAGPSTASQTTAPQQRTSSSALAAPVAKLDKNIIAAYDQYVTQKRDGTFETKIPTAITKSKPAEVAAVRASVTYMNKQASDSSSRSHQAQLASSHGGLIRHWWGWELWLDSYATGKVTAALNVGAGVAGVAAALSAAGVISSPGALPAGIAAGILGIGAGVIGLCAGSNGVVLHLSRRGIPWCTER